VRWTAHEWIACLTALVVRLMTWLMVVRRLLMVRGHSLMI
jgi:hypothetical protein